MGLFRVLMDSYKAKKGENPGLLRKGAYAILSGGTGAWLSNPADLAMVRF